MAKHVSRFVAVALVLLVAGTAFATHPEIVPPGPGNLENPYRDEVIRARQALDSAIAQFWRDYYANPWAFERLERAYFAYVDAWYAYTDALSRYWEWERTHRTFSGRVITAGGCPPDIRTHAPPYPCDPVPQPVARATVELRPAIGPRGVGTEPVGTQDPKHVPPFPPGPGKVYRAVTGPDGRFEIKGLTEGNYVYTVSHAEFETAHGEVVIGKAPARREIVLKRKAHASFRGHVVSADWPAPIPLAGGVAPRPGEHIRPVPAPRLPIAGASVVMNRFGPLPTPGPAPTLQDDAQDRRPRVATYKAVTDANGHFEFKGLPAGHYSYTVTHQDYAPATGAVGIQDRPVEREIVMMRMRVFEGRVVTVPPEVLPILRPLIAHREGGSQPGGALSGEEIEKLLASRPDVPAHGRRLVPVAGAKVTLKVEFVVIAAGREAERPDESRIQIYPPLPVPPPDIRTTMTGADGRFRLDRLRHRGYEVTVEKAGLMTFRGFIQLETPTTFRTIVLFPTLPPVTRPLAAQEQAPAGGPSVEDPFGR